MSTSSPEPHQSLTAAQVDAWIRIATVKRLELHLQATDPFMRVRAHAFWEMGQLCQAAIEEVRVVSAQLREESQAARFKSQDIVAASARLLAQYTPLTESQLLQIFKGDTRPGGT